MYEIMQDVFSKICTKEYIGRAVITIDDFQKECKKPKRYPIERSPSDKERTACDILFGFDLLKIPINMPVPE